MSVIHFSDARHATMTAKAAKKTASNALPGTCTYRADAAGATVTSTSHHISTSHQQQQQQEME
eukprot:266253-Chlamydomonas_euryale.AAC.2